ncbi:acyl-CoA N-acyltransferase [Massariosphaeria phaeospora]|uniref:Acyl-CoA N-acyltransferase n=1 Tax=Massariosphaeria phaeospora TaxID=100035 RepID=A0A7C8M4X6_9PLEO|nr:acyl-CoA N-acyltransferase [Massariosphaeria phaeospora]
MGIVAQEVLDTDIPRACEMEVAAYANNPASPVLFPGPFPPDSGEKRVNGLIEIRQNDPTVRYMQAVDKQSADILAFSKWHFYETPEAAAAAERPVNVGAGTNKAACEAFFDGMAKRKKEIMGDRPHIYLHMLHTDPKFQGRGAGGILLNWGTQEADKIGLPIYLESSPEAHRFYQKHGFEDIEEFRVDFSQFSKEGKWHIAPLMIRKPGNV